MKFGMRKPSLKKGFKARTTGRAKKAIKKTLKNHRITRPVYRRLAERRGQGRLQKKNRAFQQYGEESFRLIVQTLNKAGIEFFPAYGTLLGLVRDGRLIRHDLDLDFGVTAEGKEYDWEKLIKVLTDAGFHVFHWFEYDGVIGETAFISPLSPLVKIDFFAFFKKEDCFVSHTCWRTEGREYKSEKEFTLYEEVFPCFDSFRNVEHLGVKVPIPVNAEELLEASYTSSWRTPDENWKEENKPNKKETEGIIALIHEKESWKAD